MPAYTCPYCKNPFTASAAQVLCPHCGGSVEVPATRASRWFYARGKKRYGPYNWQHLVNLARKGELGPDDLLLQEGSKQWLPAATMPELFPHAVSAAAPTPRPAAQIAKPTPRRPERRPFRWLVATLAGAGLCLVAGATVIASYYFRGWQPAQEHQRVNVDKVDDDKNKPPDPEPPKKKIDPPKTDGASPRSDDKKKTEDKTPKPSPATLGAEQFVERLNHHRKSAGLASVALDADLCKGCQAHAKYLAQHLDPDKADASNIYEEDPKKPGYSVEGERAGQNGMIAFAEPLPALKLWMGRLTSRAPLLNPEVQSIGVGVVENGKGDWVCVIDPVRGRGEPTVIYPGPNQDDVPVSFTGGPEVPDSKATGGFPITVTFPAKKPVTTATIELRDDKGNLVETWLWTPDKPIPRGNQRNSLALIPKALLRSGTLYNVKASAQVDGKPWSLAWSFTTEDDTDRKGIWARKALAIVNAFRAHAGLKPVTLDAALSRGCLAHARYLVLNEGQPALQGLGAHDEDPKLPGFSEEGRVAGKASDIGIGDYDPLDAVDGWMGTLYHRIPILEPNLKTIGFACARGQRQGWMTVLNVITGRDPAPRPGTIVYPVPDQIEVPLSFPSGGEEPNPIPEDKTGRAGYPITAFFPKSEPLVKSLGKLTDDGGAEVPCWFSSPETPANPKFAKHQGDTVCLIPKEPLKPRSLYRVHLEGKVAGKAWQKKWEFTTGDAGLSVPSAVAQVIDRINEYRAQAGLGAVTLDESLSHGCQLHATYLVKNADAILKKKASVNDEDPLLPGFTADGLRAAKQADVFTNAPTPVTQIDDLMATFTHRVSILSPDLERVGFGCALDVGRGWRCVLDLVNGRGSGAVVLFPGPKQEDVPTIGFDRVGEIKGTPGFPISVTFPKQTIPRNAQAALTDAAGKSVDFVLSSPDKPLNSKVQQGAIGVHPREPLQAGQTYSVTVAAIVNGAEWRQTWQFTTAKAK